MRSRGQCCENTPGLRRKACEGSAQQQTATEQCKGGDAIDLEQVDGQRPGTTGPTPKQQVDGRGGCGGQCHQVSDESIPAQARITGCQDDGTQQTQDDRPQRAAGRPFPQKGAIQQQGEHGLGTHQQHTAGDAGPFQGANPQGKVHRQQQAGSQDRPPGEPPALPARTPPCRQRQQERCQSQAPEGNGHGRSRSQTDENRRPRNRKDGHRQRQSGRQPPAATPAGVRVRHPGLRTGRGSPPPQRPN